jgi:hypothetical protein
MADLGESCGDDFSDEQPQESMRRGSIMKYFLNVAAIVLLLQAFLVPTWADSFRCGSNLVSVGDSKFDVLKTCGEPTLREHVGEKTTWETQKSGKSDRDGSAETVLVEQWTYDLGSSRFPRILTFYGSTLVSIERGEKF